MKRILMIILILAILPLNAAASEYQAPPAPESVQQIVPQKAETFADGLWNVMKASMDKLNPALAKAASVCLRVAAAILLSALVSGFSSGASTKVTQLASTLAVGVTLLEPSASLIGLGEQTVNELSQYGKLLLPVMTSAMAAQGGASSSTALYAATALFDSILSGAITGIILPLLYLFLGLSIGNAALAEPILAKIRDFIKWLMTWVLKTVLYFFTGFLTVTGVVSGNADAAALKAAKLTISGAVPVVGSILSDASEAVLVGAGLMRSFAGIYGLLTIIAVFLTPFIRIGSHYLLLKATASLCGSISKNSAAALVADFSTAMGLILAMTATETVLLLVSTVCLMKGVS